MNPQPSVLLILLVSAVKINHFHTDLKQHDKSYNIGY